MLALLLASTSLVSSSQEVDPQLSLLQTAAVKSTITSAKHAVNLKWNPGEGTVVPKCGDGNLDGWIGGDGYQVGELKLNNAATKDDCIQQVLSDARCQNKQAEIDAFNLKEPHHIQSLSATYNPTHKVCYCEWGVKEANNCPGGACGWITCLARGGEQEKVTKDKVGKGGKEKRVKLSAECKAAKKDRKAKKAALKEARLAFKAARAEFKLSKSHQGEVCPKKEKPVEPKPVGVPEHVQWPPCGKGFTRVDGSVGSPAAHVRDVQNTADTAACAALCKNEPACKSYEYWWPGNPSNIPRGLCELDSAEKEEYAEDPSRIKDFTFCVKR